MNIYGQSKSIVQGRGGRAGLKGPSGPKGNQVYTLLPCNVHIIRFTHFIFTTTWCSQGDVGPSGPRGDLGAPGEKGRRGFTGSSGPDGLAVSSHHT